MTFDYLITLATALDVSIGYDGRWYFFRHPEIGLVHYPTIDGLYTALLELVHHRSTK